MARLTLRVDKEVISRAKIYARQRGTSVSRMVEAYLQAVVSWQSPAAENTPVLSAVRGILKTAESATYREHLATRYR